VNSNSSAPNAADLFAAVKKMALSAPRAADGSPRCYACEGVAWRLVAPGWGGVWACRECAAVIGGRP
jgi:hypothetical protein